MLFFHKNRALIESKLWKDLASTISESLLQRTKLSYYNFFFFTVVFRHPHRSCRMFVAGPRPFGRRKPCNCEVKGSNIPFFSECV